MTMATGRSIPTSRCSWFVGAVAVLVAFHTATPVWAWGRLGHRLTCRLAEKYLKIFDIGLIAAQGLFAKRRMGKAEFLEQVRLLGAKHDQATRPQHPGLVKRVAGAVYLMSQRGSTRREKEEREKLPLISVTRLPSNSNRG